MSKYTPGPWERNGLSGIIAKGKAIAIVQGREFEEAQANARLIASAPELLEACKTIENVLRNRDEHSWFPIEKRIQVQQAIAKAEGN